jgi:hypothetical protein
MNGWWRNLTEIKSRHQETTIRCGRIRSSPRTHLIRRCRCRGRRAVAVAPRKPSRPPAPANVSHVLSRQGLIYVKSRHRRLFSMFRSFSMLKTNRFLLHRHSVPIAQEEENAKQHSRVGLRSPSERWPRGAGHVNRGYTFDQLKGVAAILNDAKSQSLALAKDQKE